MENQGWLVSGIPSLDERRNRQQKPLKDVAEKQHWTARTNGVIDLIQRDQSCTREQAIAWLCDYWATKEGIDLGHENPLLDPAEYGHESEPQPGRLQRAWTWLNDEI